MGMWFRFTVLPPVDTAVFDHWQDSFDDKAPLADFSEGGSQLTVHGSYSSRSGYLADYWPALRDWVAQQGSVITIDSGDYQPEGFEKTDPEVMFG